MLQRTMQLRLVNQTITTSEEGDYVRRDVQTLQQLWRDAEERTEEWRDVPTVITKTRK